MTPIERAARAIRPTVEGDNALYWASEYGRPAPDASLEAIVRAVIESLREPSEGMADAGSQVPLPSFGAPLGLSNEEVGAIWSTMIDAALRE